MPATPPNFSPLRLETARELRVHEREILTRLTRDRRAAAVLHLHAGLALELVAVHIGPAARAALKPMPSQRDLAYRMARQTLTKPLRKTGLRLTALPWRTRS